MAVRAVFLTFALGTLLGSTLAGQESRLEEWTVGTLARGWAPRWRTAGAPPLEDDDHPHRLRISLGSQHLSLGRVFSLARSEVSLGIRTPLGDRVGLVASSVASSWETKESDRSLLSTERSIAGAIGVDFRLAPDALGRWGGEVLAAWDAGPGWLARLTGASDHHGLELAAWRTTARESVLQFPADSLRDLGAGHRAIGTAATLTLSARTNGLELATETTARREVFDPTPDPPSGFLTVRPDGSHALVRSTVTLAAHHWAIETAYRARSVSMESRIERRGVSAGRLPVAILRLRGWHGNLAMGRPADRWILVGGHDRLTGRLSARLETWPFISLWRSLSALAYRLNGDLAIKGVWLRIGHLGTGLDWSVEAGRYRMIVERDTWYVTSFGFGRNNRRWTRTNVDPVILVGGDLIWRPKIGPHGLAVRLGASMPVHLRTRTSSIEPSSSSSIPSSDVGFSLRMAIEWSR